LFNAEGKTGSIGRIPPYMAHRFPTALVRFDADKEQPARNAEGYCIRCAPNEPGEAIGRIAGSTSAIGSQFEGYTNAEQSANKVLRNVFEPEDAWFRTGDLLRKDEQGYFYFVDRIGDTFRWKGENVATTEVAEAISAFPGVKDVVVYGVAVPGTDGRTGMACLVADGTLNLADLRAHLGKRLPDYAHPRFVRICGYIEATATFKYSRAELSCEGYNPIMISDPIYVNHPTLCAFVQLDAESYNSIQSGAMRI
jgi:fatty-acyl-CoA synthase